MQREKLLYWVTQNDPYANSKNHLVNVQCSISMPFPAFVLVMIFKKREQTKK